MASVILQLNETRASLYKGKKLLGTYGPDALTEVYKTYKKISLKLDIPYIVREIPVPKAGKKQVATAIGFEIEKLYPSVYKDFVFDYHVTSQDSSIVLCKVFLVKQTDINTFMSSVPDDVYIDQIVLTAASSGKNGFMTEELKKRNAYIDKKDLKNRIFVYTPIVCILIAGLFIWSARNSIVSMHLLQDKITLISPEYKKQLIYFNSYKSDFNILKQKAYLSTANISVTSLLYTITTCLPSKCYLLRISIEDNSVTLEGRSESEKRVFFFINELTHVLKEREVNLLYSEKTGDSSETGFKVHIK
jgi:hypothetical protein